ncbi:MAG: hypothetical protein LBM77_00395, partial [Spirochaetaceae bacterium]|nr:hypothetical protein [Spirochaetaceae bacterium]
MVLRGTWKRILLFLLGILFFQGKSLFAQVSVAVFPLKATDVPTESNASSINGIISNAIAASSIGRFTTAQIGETLDDPAVPPDPKSASDCTYSLTSELLYDTTRSETQLYLYLYDNTTEKLVVSDQLVYQTETEAEEFAPFLVDSILDRIPKYDITVKKPDGGTISFNGQPLEISEDTQVIREQGAGTIQLSAQGQTGKSFQAWEITGANVDGNILIITETANPYSLELSTEKYTGTGTSAEDPFGTIVPLTIEAQFGRGSGSTEYEPQFNVNLGWSPSM